jgi:hypothetical protein
MIHGAPLTVHVTSPTSLLSSKMVKVVVIGPLISVARALPAQTMSITKVAHHTSIVRRIISSLFPFNFSYQFASVFIADGGHGSLERGLKFFWKNFERA